MCPATDGKRLGLTDTWHREVRSLCVEFFKAATKGDGPGTMAREVALRRFLEEELERLSRL